MMNDDSKLEQLFQTYRAACPEVEPSTNFMPNLWQRIERRHSFGFVFRNVARTTMTACAALCVLLVFMNFAYRDRVTVPNYTDVLMAEHTAENTYFTEGLRATTGDGEAAAPHP
jgi:Na+-transporting NADH:ubiquinone oxidoreductase subunit NqrB